MSTTKSAVALKDSKLKPASIKTVGQLLALAEDQASLDLEDYSTFQEFFENVINPYNTIKAGGIYNSESYLEAGQMFSRFEVLSELSKSYCTCIQFEIRDNEFCIYVAINRMQDNGGLQSSSWDVAQSDNGDYLEDELKFEESDTIKAACKATLELLTMLHAQLLDTVGIPPQLAKAIVDLKWKK